MSIPYRESAFEGVPDCTIAGPFINIPRLDESFRADHVTRVKGTKHSATCHVYVRHCNHLASGSEVMMFLVQMSRKDMVALLIEALSANPEGRKV